MRDERVRQRRSSMGRKNRNNDGFGRRNSFLTMDKGIEVRAKEPEMNRVSECKEKQESEVKKAAVGSIWMAKNSTTGFHYLVTPKGYVTLETGFYCSHSGNWSNGVWEQIYCVTIERDPDEQ